MGYLKVGSREYKVMLKTAKFTGDQQQLRKQTARFWQDFNKAIADHVFDTDGALDEIDKKRSIVFWDTADHCLRTNGYVFRERHDFSNGNDDKQREVTLKFRHPDRYLAAGQDVTAADGIEEDAKFEEDIKAPFQSIFSLSNKIPLAPEENLAKVSDILRLFPHIKEGLGGCDPETTVTPVGNYKARELVIDGSDFQLGEDPKVEAECAIVVWHDHAGGETDPEVVEFSFRYKNDDDEGEFIEAYATEVVRRAYAVFQILQDTMGEWVDPQSLTKTAFVYSQPQIVTPVAR